MKRGDPNVFSFARPRSNRPSGLKLVHSVQLDWSDWAEERIIDLPRPNYGSWVNIGEIAAILAGVVWC